MGEHRIDFLRCTSWKSVTPSTSTTHVVMWVESQSISTWLRGFSLCTPVSSILKIDSQSNPSGRGAVLRGHTWVVFRDRAPSWLHTQLLRSDLVELRPPQFSLRLRERSISRSDITNRAVRAHRHIEIAIPRASTWYEPNLF